jgi:hypothetical protein
MLALSSSETQKPRGILPVLVGMDNLHSGHSSSPATVLPLSLDRLEIHCPQIHLYDWLTRLEIVQDRLLVLSDIDFYCQNSYGDNFDLFQFQNCDLHVLDVLTNIGITMHARCRGRGWKKDRNDYDLAILNPMIGLRTSVFQDSKHTVQKVSRPGVLGTSHPYVLKSVYSKTKDIQTCERFSRGVVATFSERHRLPPTTACRNEQPPLVLTNNSVTQVAGERIRKATMVSDISIPAQVIHIYYFWRSWSYIVNIDRQRSVRHDASHVHVPSSASPRVCILGVPPTMLKPTLTGA